MARPVQLAALALAVSFLVPVLLRAQGWSPPSRQMPSMPTAAELSGGWIGTQGAWFQGAGDTSALRGTASGAKDGRALQARFTGGGTPVPVAIWSDRNGDGKADMIEIYRGGAVSFQLIDADYDGTANVLREYEGGGKLLRESRI
ncbi:MAG: hypothetical protein KY464_03580 [Gemmatimonadetes bacterium]|nr:hypothetical protein [Gemmatimonadota bacterium]